MALRVEGATAEQLAFAGHYADLVVVLGQAAPDGPPWAADGDR